LQAFDHLVAAIATPGHPAGFHLDNKGFSSLSPGIKANGVHFFVLLLCSGPGIISK
jgi:hypothetical protein